MATFRMRMAAHKTSVFLNTGHFAETVSYTPAGGSASSITAVVVRHGADLEEVASGNVEVELADIHVDVSDVEMPARGDRVETTEADDSTGTWGVDSKRYQEGMWVLGCVKLSGREVAGGEYRTTH